MTQHSQPQTGEPRAAALHSRASSSRGAEISRRIRRGDRGIRLGAFFSVAALLTRWTLFLGLNPRIHHSERVPGSGAALLVSNHQSYFDPALIGASLPRRCCFLARDSLFRVPLLGWLIRHLDALPVARESRVPKKGVELSLQALEAGRLLLLFPEGTRTRDGSFGRLRRGVALIARRSRAPIVPVWIEGAVRAWPRGRLLPRPATVRVAFGEALWFDETKESVDAFLERLRSAMECLGRECRERIRLPESW